MPMPLSRTGMEDSGRMKVLIKCSCGACLEADDSNVTFPDTRDAFLSVHADCAVFKGQPLVQGFSDMHDALDGMQDHERVAIFKKIMNGYCPTCGAEKSGGRKCSHCSKTG